MKESICEFCGISYTKVGGGKQRACSIACYEKHRRKDPARAAWHREYMHNYFKERGREKQPTKQICTLHFICNSLRGSNATPQGDQVMLFG